MFQFRDSFRDSFRVSLGFHVGFQFRDSCRGSFKVSLGCQLRVSAKVSFIFSECCLGFLWDVIQGVI